MEKEAECAAGQGAQRGRGAAWWWYYRRPYEKNKTSPKISPNGDFWRHECIDYTKHKIIELQEITDVINTLLKIETAVPPWVDSNEEETIQQQILALSADRRNFLRDPPAGVQFNFDFDQMYPVAMIMLQEDELLNRMRFDLVPKHVKEEVFWRNYFYRVSLIKQSAQITALAAQQQAVRKEKNAGEENRQLTETVRPKTPPVAIQSQLKPQEDDDEISTSPGVSEFVSDAFDACNLNQEDLRKEIEQLVLEKKQETSIMDEETAEWEKELQQELQEYEVVTESEKRDDNWDKEIEEMLQGEN